MTTKKPESNSGVGSAVTAVLAIAAGAAVLVHHNLHNTAPHSGTDAKKAGHVAVKAVTHSESIKHNKIRLTMPITYHETSTGQEVPSRIGNFRYFSQTDRQWAWDAYNSNGHKSYDIGWNGCAPTVGAMVASNLTGKRITPVEVANYYKNQGYVLPDKTGGGTDGEPAIKALAAHYGKKAYNISGSFDSIKTVIDDGGFVVLNGQDSEGLTPALPGGHVIMIRGYTDDRLLEIADPASIANTMSDFSPELITGPASYIVAVTN